MEFSSYGGYNIAIYFIDGSVLVSKSGYDYFFFPNGKNFDKENFVSVSESGEVTAREGQGITIFLLDFLHQLKMKNFIIKEGLNHISMG